MWTNVDRYTTIDLEGILNLQKQTQIILPEDCFK